MSQTPFILILKELYRRSDPFLGLYVMLLIPALFVLFYFGKGEIHLFVNHYHSPFFDKFFYYVTKLGEPAIVIAMIIGLLFFRYRYSLILALSAALGAGSSGFIKFLIEDDMRPMKFFQYYNAPLHFVEGVRLNEYNSFPSGHTTEAFVFLFLVSVFFQKRWLSALCLFLAALVAYSRMYLSMHFLIDVTVGSLLGLLCAGGVYWLVTYNYRFTKRKWWDGRLRRRRRLEAIDRDE